MRDFKQICWPIILRGKFVDNMRIRIISMLRIAVENLKELVIADLRFWIRTLKIMIADIGRELKRLKRSCGIAVSD